MLALVLGLAAAGGATPTGARRLQAYSPPPPPSPSPPRESPPPRPPYAPPAPPAPPQRPLNLTPDDSTSPAVGIVLLVAGMFAVCFVVMFCLYRSFPEDYTGVS